MITKNVVGRHAGNTIRYLSRLNKEGEYNAPLLTTFASDDPAGLVAEAEAWGDLNPKLGRKTNHVIFSQELDDKPLTPGQWARAISIYIEQRNMGGVPFVAYLHSDHGREGRLPHLHVLFMRSRTDGTTAPDANDADVNRATSRAIEREFSLIVNEGKKYSGSDRNAQRERSAEREGHPPGTWQVDAAVVDRCIQRSRNVRELREALRAEGIEIRVRAREGTGIYAWSLRNVGGPAAWTSGSKLTPNNEFGWAKVQQRLDQSFQLRMPANARKRTAPRMKNGLGRAPAPRPVERLDEAVEAGVGAAIGVLSRLIKAANSGQRPIPGNPRIRRKPAKPVASRPAIVRPRG